MLRSLFQKIFRKRISNIEYWEERAKLYGSLAVLNIGHSESEIQRVTALQIDTIFPYVQKYLVGNEKNILDFGCGTGRFSGALAELSGGRVIGVDPVQKMLDIAPAHPNVTYLKANANGTIPVPDKSMDLVWICLVLVGIPDKSLTQVCDEIQRVLKDEGLLVLIENTSLKKDVAHWYFRNNDFYIGLFKTKKLNYAAGYVDLQEQISILIGR